MKDIVQLRRFWQDHSNQPLVLCTLVKKTGSSYRQEGAKKIIALTTEKSCGLLSGGCLEGDIEKTARENADQLPFTKSFSTLNEEDRLLGYQTGCSGVIDILFEKLPADGDMDKYLPFGPRITLTIIGCGADADPYADFADALGWDAQFIDYRSDLIRNDRFLNFNSQYVPLDKIADRIPRGPQSGVVLMTHNFEADLQIFSELIGSDIGYLGCLGPRRRYELLKEDLLKFHDKTVPADWEQKTVKAPPGLTIRNTSPSEIAFAVVADIQMKLGETVE